MRAHVHAAGRSTAHGGRESQLPRCMHGRRPICQYVYHRRTAGAGLPPPRRSAARSSCRAVLHGRRRPSRNMSSTCGRPMGHDLPSVTLTQFQFQFHPQSRRIRPGPRRKRNGSPPPRPPAGRGARSPMPPVWDLHWDCGRLDPFHSRLHARDRDVVAAGCGCHGERLRAARSRRGCVALTHAISARHGTETRPGFNGTGRRRRRSDASSLSPGRPCPSRRHRSCILTTLVPVQSDKKKFKDSPSHRIFDTYM